MSAQILHNSAALHALKRHQLVSLSKKYGLKASGKNVDMIERLQAHALTLPAEADFHVPEPEPTPAPSRILRSTANDPNDLTSPSAHTTDGSCSTPKPSVPLVALDTAWDGSPIPTKRNLTTAAPILPGPDEHSFILPDSLGPQLNNKASVISNLSASWSILSESDASIMEPLAEESEGSGGAQGSVRGWKSAGNGEALTDFGIPGDRPDFGTASSRSRSAGSRQSLFALASSITRSGSRHLRARPSAAPSAYTVASTSTFGPERPTTPTREEQIVDPLAPSPASTVGIPRRHSKVTLLERPSTLRLCSPTPQTPGGSGRISFGGMQGAENDTDADAEEDKLPFVSSAQKVRMIKISDQAGRRSMTPSRYSASASKESRKLKSSLTPSKNGRGRKSMTATVHFAIGTGASSPPSAFSLGTHVHSFSSRAAQGDGYAPFMAPSIYPPLPPPTFVPVSTTTFEPDADAPPVPPVPMPGTWFHSKPGSTSTSTSAPVMNVAGDTDNDIDMDAATTPVNSPPAVPFAFGTDSPGVSSAQFTLAARAILEQMNAKLPEGQRIGQELLKGKQASIPKAEGSERKVGGWGLSARGRDRFAAAHEREFAKMQSIGDKARFGKKANSHAPNPSIFKTAGPVAALALDTMTPGKKRKLSGGKSTTTLLSGSETGEGCDSGMDIKNMPSAPNGEPMTKRKRTRLSQGPQAMMGSLRVAGRSMMNLLDGQGEGAAAETPGRKKSGLKQRLSLLRPFKRAATSNDRRLSAQGIAEMAAHERRRSIRGVHEAQMSARGAETAEGPSSNCSASATSTSTTLSSRIPKPATMVPKSRLPSSMSAQTVTTTRTASSSRTLPTRSPLPDFGQPRTVSGASRNVSASGISGSLRHKASASVALSTTSKFDSVSKKQSQADLIRKARPAPPPPSAFSYRNISGIMPAGSGIPTAATTSAIGANASGAGRPPVVRSSTLMQPTAASLARMQATVRPLPVVAGASGGQVEQTDPRTTRPLPRPPSTIFKPAQIATSNPFGKGESRENLFETTFNSAPAPRPLPTIPSMSPIRLPNSSGIFDSSGPAPLGERSAFNGEGINTTAPADNGFHYKGKPDLTSAAPRTPKRSPSKPKRGAYAGHTTASAARVRTMSIKHKASTPGTGLSGAGGSLVGVKSRGDLKSEVDAQRRKAKIKGRLERRAEEKELREMLGGLSGDVRME